MSLVTKEIYSAVAEEDLVEDNTYLVEINRIRAETKERGFGAILQSFLDIKQGSFLD
jgi:hypothetical protein